MLKADTIKKLIPLLLILFLAFFVRFIFLDKIPNAIGGDELVYVLTAKSMLVSGSDLTQTWSPLSVLLFNYPPDQTQAELMYFLQLPFVALGNDLLSTRILNLILGVGLVLLIYAIAKHFFDERTALIAGLVAAFNPWFIYIGRTGYEAIPAIFLYYLGFYMLLKAKEKGILLSIPIFILAFYSYIGAKVIFLPFITATAFYSYYFINKKKYGKYYLIVLAFCTTLVAIFAFSILTSPVSRISEIITPNAPKIAEQVDKQRHDSIIMPFTSIFENKYTQVARIIITKVFKIFSFDYLFISGDHFFSISRNGLFYIADLAFLVVGLWSLHVKKRKVFYFFLALIFISIIPQLIHSANIDNFTYHLNLMFPIFVLIIAWGINTVIGGFKGRKLYIVTFLIGIIYFFLVSYFLNIYFFQHPLMGYFDFKLRVLSHYASINKDKKIIIHSVSGKDYFKKYIFYANKIIPENKKGIAKNITLSNAKLDNVEFKNCDHSLDPQKHKNKIIIFDINCKFIGNKKTALKISQLSDAGGNFFIFNDSLCSKYNLNAYPQIKSVKQFSIENMEEKDFCQTYINL